MIIMILFAVVAVLALWACLKAGSDADDAAEIEMLKQEETEEVDVDFEADMLRDAMKEEHW